MHVAEIPVIRSYCPIHLYQPNISSVGKEDGIYFYTRFFLDIFMIDDDNDGHKVMMAYLNAWRHSNSRMLQRVYEDPVHAEKWPLGKSWTKERFLETIAHIRSHSSDHGIDPDNTNKFFEYSLGLLQFWHDALSPQPPLCPRYSWSKREWTVPGLIAQCPVILDDEQGMQQSMQLHIAKNGFGNAEVERRRCWSPAQFTKEVRQCCVSDLRQRANKAQIAEEKEEGEIEDEEVDEGKVAAA